MIISTIVNLCVVVIKIALSVLLLPFFVFGRIRRSFQKEATHETKNV
jgi:hypothetical protein